MASNRRIIEVHGHRGCRGYLPENTIPAFLKAVMLGVDAIELDVVVTEDKKVLVSHEAWFSPEICLNPDGTAISADESPVSLYQLPYEEISKYDCGLKPHPSFPDQLKIAATKPLLSDVIATVETFIAEHDLPAVAYNIEVKSFPEGDHIFHPPPDMFTELLLEVLQANSVLSKTFVQSFDVRPLQELHRKVADPPLGLLVEDDIPAEQHLQELDFVPFAYNPHYSLLSSELVECLKNRNLSIYTWTVNSPDILPNIVDLDIDGIITDYPILIKKMLDATNIKT